MRSEKVSSVIAGAQEGSLRSDAGCAQVGMDAGMSTRKIALAQLVIDGGTQVRANLSRDVMAEYAEQMAEGVKFPPVVVFKTKEGFVLVDGFHRVAAAREAGYKDIEAEVHVGNLIEAVEYALRANTAHGLRRSNADKKRAVEIALKYWPDDSSRKLGDRCGVSDKFVTEVRESTANGSQSAKRVGSDGREQPAHKPARVNDTQETLATATQQEVQAPSEKSAAQENKDAGLVALQEAWKAASPVVRSAFLAWLFAAVKQVQHTGAWASISREILVAHETH